MNETIVAWSLVLFPTIITFVGAFVYCFLPDLRECYYDYIFSFIWSVAMALCAAFIVFLIAMAVVVNIPIFQDDILKYY